MAYDKLPPSRITWGNQDFGTAASILLYFTGPKGKKGWLYDYGITGVTEAFIATTLHPGMQVGIVGDEDAHGDLIRFTSAAIAGGTYSVRRYYKPTDTAWATYMVNQELPADTAIMVTLEEGTGGSDTGQATPFVDVIWDD